MNHSKAKDKVVGCFGIDITISNITYLTSWRSRSRRRSLSAPSPFSSAALASWAYSVPTSTCRCPAVVVRASNGGCSSTCPAAPLEISPRIKTWPSASGVRTSTASELCTRSRPTPSLRWPSLKRAVHTFVEVPLIPTTMTILAAAAIHHSFIPLHLKKPHRPSMISTITNRRPRVPSKRYARACAR